jgi:hypothetical protein
VRQTIRKIETKCKIDDLATDEHVDKWRRYSRNGRLRKKMANNISPVPLSHSLSL